MLQTQKVGVLCLIPLLCLVSHDLFLDFTVDDVCHQVRTCGIFTFRAHGGDGRGTSRERTAEETNICGAQWWWPLNQTGMTR